MPDRLDLVAAGHRPAAILNTLQVDETLARAARAGLAAEVWRSAGEDAQGRLATEDGAAQIYVAPSQEDARRLRDLDRAVRDAGQPEIPRENHALGAALGYPDCCAWAYPHTAFEVSGEGEDVRWARNFVWRAGPGRVGPWSSWLNFHAARIFGLEFFEHFPCCPWCRPTQESNQTLANMLYDATGVARVRAAMEQSIVLWPDGSFLPFLCTGTVGAILNVAEAGQPRGEVRPHFTDHILTEIPGQADSLDGLRQDHGRWEMRVKDRWQRLDSGAGEPLVLAFEAGTSSAVPVSTS